MMHFSMCSDALWRNVAHYGVKSMRNCNALNRLLQRVSCSIDCLMQRKEILKKKKPSTVSTKILRSTTVF